VHRDDPVCSTGRVRIPGYLEVDRAVLVDGDDLMADPLFWPAFLVRVGLSGLAPEAFDVDPAELGPLLDEMDDPAEWLVFTVPLAHGAAVRIVRRNAYYEHGPGTDYLLDLRDGSDALLLASLESHYSGPGFAWPEIAGRSPGQLLRLLPACSDVDTDDDTVAAALAAVGAVRHQRAVAAELTGNPWAPGPCTWRVVDGLTVCDEPDSPRGPDGEHLDIIGRALAPQGRS